MRSIVLVVVTVFLASCSNTVTVADLFEKEGCSGPCYQRMPCEGEEITVAIPLDGSNVLENGNIFFVKDQMDPQKTIKVEFDASIGDDAKAGFKENIGKTVYVSGHLEGYDLLNPTSCKRAHIIYVSKAEDIVYK